MSPSCGCRRLHVALCAGQSAFWHAFPQYRTALHALHSFSLPSSDLSVLILQCAHVDAAPPERLARTCDTPPGDIGSEAPKGCPWPTNNSQTNWQSRLTHLLGKQRERHSKLSQGFTAPLRVSASGSAFRLLLRIGFPSSAPLRGTVRLPSVYRHLLRIGSAPAKLLSASS
jgi:hypothetical protein